MPWKIEFALKFFTALKYFYLSGFLRNLRLPWKQSLSWIFSLYLIYFLHSGCLSNFCLPWKTEYVLNSLYWMYFLSFRILNNLRLPWKFSLHWNNEFWGTCAALKTEFFLKYFTVLNIVFTFRIFEQLVLALKKKVCPEFTVLNIYFLSFRILNYLRLPWKTEFTLKFFTALKYYLSFRKYFTVLNIVFTFRIFEQLELALNFSSRGGGRPPRLVRHWLRTPPAPQFRSLAMKICCRSATRLPPLDRKRAVQINYIGPRRCPTRSL